MASGKQLWDISQQRIQSAKALIEASDWEGAAYMMAWSLETALKAASCKSLNLKEYPEKTASKTTNNHFMTHDFNVLLTISGLSYLFEPNAPVATSAKWSRFLQAYPDRWPNMRYDPQIQTSFNSLSIKDLYEILYESEGSILKTIKREQSW